MGWIAYHKDGTITREGTEGRPVQAGEEGQLRMIIQEDYGHKVAVDLINGVIIIDYGEIDAQGGNIAVSNPNTVLYVCDETTVVGNLTKVRKTRPNKEGNFEYKHSPFEWRPIWFSRVFGYDSQSAVKVIGLQTTLGSPYKRRNVKKMVSIFPDGSLGID